MKRLLCVAIGIGMQFAGLVFAQTDKPTRLELVLPDDSIDDLPSAQFIQSVNDTARRYLECSGDCTIRIRGRDQAARDYARIILHSYGIGDDRLSEAGPQDVSSKPNVPRAAQAAAPPVEKPRTVIVVLGNQPLDSTTPTLDMVHRVETAIHYAKAHAGTVLILTGGDIGFDGISEAKMMGLIALSRGASRGQLVLEDEATTTSNNARLSAPLVEKLSPVEVLICTKLSHIEWALPAFRQHKVFESAQPLVSDTDEEAIIRQMQEYLKLHPGNSRVRQRLQALRAGGHGID